MCWKYTISIECLVLIHLLIMSKDNVNELHTLTLNKVYAVHGADTVQREMKICHMLDIELTLNLKIHFSIYTMIETCLTTVIRESATTN